jgi:hypothetical protein
MRWLTYIVLAFIFTVCAFGFGSAVRQLWRRLRGRRICANWLCLKCQTPFGSSAKTAEFRRASNVRGVYFEGAVMHCARCGEDSWFYWDGTIFDSTFRQIAEVEVVCKSKEQGQIN